MRTQLLVLSVATGLLGFAACDIEDFDIGGGSERYTQDFHYSYPLQPGGRLSVETFNGSVDISGWDENTVDISGTKYARTPELRDSLKIEIQHTADSVYIRTVRPSDHRGNMGAKYIIKVPRRTQLDRISSSNGGIHTLNIEGAARLKTSNGGVRAENVKGSLEAGTSNGGIHVRMADPESSRPIRLETTNGGIELTVEKLNQNAITAATSNGGITLHLPGNIGASLIAHTSNSSITTDFEVQTQGSTNKNHLEGRIGSGGPTIDLSTSNGRISLLKM